MLSSRTMVSSSVARRVKEKTSPARASAAHKLVQTCQDYGKAKLYWKKGKYIYTKLTFTSGLTWCSLKLRSIYVNYFVYLHTWSRRCPICILIIPVKQLLGTPLLQNCSVSKKKVWMLRNWNNSSKLQAR